jgi:hypothetical protein
MSFEIGGLSNHNSRVEASVPSRDGGGGNTGYFQQQKEEGHEENKKQDVFESSSKRDEADEASIDFKDLKIIEIITDFLNQVINKLFSIFNIKITFNNKK